MDESFQRIFLKLKTNKLYVWLIRLPISIHGINDGGEGSKQHERNTQHPQTASIEIIKQQRTQKIYCTVYFIKYTVQYTL